MFRNLYLNENTKNFKRSMLWIELGLLALLVVGFSLLFYTVFRRNPGGQIAPPGAHDQLRQFVTWPTSLLTVLGFASGNALGGLLLIVFVGTVTAQEYSWRTLHLWLSRGVSRSRLLGAKFASLFIPVVLIVLTPLVVGGIITALFTVQLNGRLPLDQVNFTQLALSLLRTVYTLLPYGALAFFLAVATRSVVAAVGGGLAYALLGESILAQVLGLTGSLAKISQYLPINLAKSLLGLNQAVVQAGDQAARQAANQPELLAPIPAAIGIALWTVLFVGLALWVFQRQDLSE